MNNSRTIASKYSQSKCLDFVKMLYKPKVFLHKTDRVSIGTQSPKNPFNNYEITMLAFSYFKELYDLFDKHKLEEAKPLLMKMQARYIILCDENTILRTQLRNYIKQDKLVDDMYLNHAGYWFVEENVNQGPFCKPCYQEKKELVMLEAESLYWHCPNCQSTAPQFKAVNDHEQSKKHKKSTKACTHIAFSETR